MAHSITDARTLRNCSAHNIPACAVRIASKCGFRSARIRDLRVETLNSYQLGGQWYFVIRINDAHQSVAALVRETVTNNARDSIGPHCRVITPVHLVA